MKKISAEKLLMLAEKRKLGKPEISALLNFNREYQNRTLEYFAKIKIDFDEANPGLSFPGLFAEVDSISGRVRPLDKQRAWSWGDCRALGIWSYLLAKNAMPALELKISGRNIRLDEFFTDYCDKISRALLERYDINGGYFPFLVDIRTNKASDDPRNIKVAKGKYDPSHVFAASGFMQYGILKEDDSLIGFGLSLMDESLKCGESFQNIDHITKKILPQRGEGFLMVCVGAMIDSLKCAQAPQIPQKTRDCLARLIPGAVRVSQYILDKFSNPETGEFWELNDDKDRPFVDTCGGVICDPGHSAEAAGFFAELTDFIDDKSLRTDLVERLLKIIGFVSKFGYSKMNLLYKAVDLKTGNGVFDRISEDGKKYRTAPWWNLSELAAASVKLHQISGDEDSLSSYVKARNSLYSFYPNELIGGLMVQTLDADTGVPLPFNPATGNLDPMHSQRSREREIEALQLLQENLP